jgi:hypothetical protein
MMTTDNTEANAGGSTYWQNSYYQQPVLLSGHYITII